MLTLGLFAASGNTVFSIGFLRQWLEVFWLYPSGISMIPIAQYRNGLVMSYCVVTLYLGAVIAALLRRRFAERDASEIITGLIAILGLFYLIYYIGRSHPYNLFHMSIPFSIVLVVTLHWITAAVASRKIASGGALSIRKRAPIALAAAGAVLLIANPEFRSYPNLLHSLNPSSSRQSECYFPSIQDVCVDKSEHASIVQFQSVVAEMERLTREEKRIAVIANDDTALYVASGATPWSRYSPLLPPLMTKSMLDEVDVQLSRRPVDFVFLLRADPSTYSSHSVVNHQHTTDCWTQLALTTRKYYYFDHDCGPFGKFGAAKWPGVLTLRRHKRHEALGGEFCFLEAAIDRRHQPLMSARHSHFMHSTSARPQFVCWLCWLPSTLCMLGFLCTVQGPVQHLPCEPCIKR